MPQETAAADPNCRAPAGSREQREDERFIRDWEARAARFGKPPPLGAFDLSPLRGAAWAHRFLVAADADPERHAFMIYGGKFARMLGLPEMPEQPMPMLAHLPDRYRPVFAKGCGDALARQAPVCLSGVFGLGAGEPETYRVCFAPVALPDRRNMRGVFGAFNCRLRRPEFWPRPRLACASPGAVG